MKTMAFDGIVREMSEVSTRRGVFRLLGGAAAMSAGLVLGGESLAKGKNHGKAKVQGHGQARGKGKGAVQTQGKKGAKITICYQTQTRTVKKKGYQSAYPGATVGPCPVVPSGCTGTGQSTCPTGQTCVTGQCQATTPQPVACTRWLISGGPNQYDPILVDDDLSIFNISRGGVGLLALDQDRKALPLPPSAPFEANVGETLKIVAYDGGGCRSLGQLWLHCLATGQKRVLFTGYSGNGSCTNAPGTFINEQVTVSL
jgi:hypothetical protein